MLSWVLGIVLGQRNSGSPTLSHKDFLVGSLHFVVLAFCCGNNQIETGFLNVCPLIRYIAALYLRGVLQKRKRVRNKVES